MAFQFIGDHPRLMNRLLKAPRSMMMFLYEGKIRLINAGDARSAGALEKNGARIMGVYDSNCHPDWLMEDLIWWGNKLSGQLKEAA